MPKQEMEIQQLVENVNEVGLDLVDITICDHCEGGGIMMIAKLYPNGYTECYDTCGECGGNGYMEREIGDWTSAFIY